jgi:hypothetical protein
MPPEIQLSSEAIAARQSAAQFSKDYAEVADFTTLAHSARQPKAVPINTLDPESQSNLNEFYMAMRSNRPLPATVINMHPWPLPGVGQFTRAITIPACPPGDPYNYSHIRGYSADKKYQDNGSFTFGCIRPIQKAVEFFVNFNNPDSGGPGVIVYEGEGHPDKVLMVNTYDPLGKAFTDEKSTIEYDAEERPTPVISLIPIQRNLAEYIAEVRAQRNAHYLAKVQLADTYVRDLKTHGRRPINPLHRLMAEVLFAEGVIDAIPDWGLATKMQRGLAKQNCRSCGNPYNDGAFRCTCGHIINPLEAYRDSAIEYTHVSMDSLSADERVEAMKIKQARDEAKELAQMEMDDQKKGKGKK